MKYNKHILQLFLTTFLLLGVGYLEIKAQQKCNQGLLKIAEYNKQFSTKENVYTKYITQTNFTNEKGQETVNEMWKVGEYIKYKIPYLTVYRDNKHQIMILEDTRTIVIHEAEQVTTNAQPAIGSPQEQIKNLYEMALSVNCKSIGNASTMTILMPDKIENKLNYLEQVSIEYNTDTGLLYSNTYTYRGPYKGKTEIYKYIESKTKFDTREVKKSALSRILLKGELREKYRDYQVNDLRNNKR